VCVAHICYTHVEFDWTNQQQLAYILSPSYMARSVTPHNPAQVLSLQLSDDLLYSTHIPKFPGLIFQKNFKLANEKQVY
jgi:hypothetical protein